MKATAKRIPINKSTSLQKEKGLGGDRIIIHTNEFIEIIKPDQILFVQAESNYSTFFMKNGRKVLSSKTLGTYFDKLSDHNFIRPHQSFIVNPKEIMRIKKVDSPMLCLSDNSEIPISRARRKDIISYFS